MTAPGLPAGWENRPHYVKEQPAEAVAPNMREALADLLAFHTESANFSPSVMLTAGKFEDFMRDIKVREVRVIAAARAALAAAPSAPQQTSGHCTRGNGCVCGGDTDAVREACRHWQIEKGDAA